MSDKRKVHPREVASNLNVTERTVRRMCERGDIPAVKAGRQWRIYPDWEKYLEHSQKKCEV